MHANPPCSPVSKDSAFSILPIRRHHSTTRKLQNLRQKNLCTFLRYVALPLTEKNTAAPALIRSLKTRVNLGNL
jgi:hypothetical protein